MPKSDAEASSSYSSAGDYVRFKPKRVVGLSGVTEAVVTSERLRLLVSGRWMNFDFAAMVQRSWLDSLRRASPRLFGPGSQIIGERNWRDSEGGRSFVLYSSPRLKLYMPVEDDRRDYASTTFAQVQEILRKGGFSTIDRSGSRG